MNSQSTFLIFSLSLLFCLNLSAHDRERVETPGQWNTDTKAALTEAEATGKPILAVFR